MNPYLIALAAVVLAGLTLLIMRSSKDLVGALAILVFFLPFERIPTMAVGSFTLKINHIVGFVLILFWILDRIYYHKKFIKNPIAPILLIFVSAMAISIISAPLKSRAIIFLLVNIFTIMLSVVTIDVLRSHKDISRIEKIIFASSWIILLFSIWQFLGDMAGLPISVTGLLEGYSKVTFGFPRIQAFSKEPLYLGNYLLLPLGFIVAKIFSEVKKTYLDWLLLIGLIGVFILTLSRGALLGLAVFILVLMFFYPKKIFTAKIITISTISLVVIFMGIFMGISLLGPKIQQKFVGHLLVNDYGKSESTVSRLTANDDAINDWKEHKFFGVGLGNFGGSRTNYDLNNPKTNDIVNNEYLEILAETGIFGFGAFVILIMTIFARSIYVLRLTKNNIVKLKPLLIGLTATFAGMLAQYAFFSTLGIMHIWVMIGLLIAVQSIIINEIRKKKNDNF